MSCAFCEGFPPTTLLSGRAGKPKVEGSTIRSVILPLNSCQTCFKFVNTKYDEALYNYRLDLHVSALED